MHFRGALSVTMVGRVQKTSVHGPSTIDLLLHKDLFSNCGGGISLFSYR